MDERPRLAASWPKSGLRFGGARFDAGCDAFVDVEGRTLDLRPQSAQVLIYLAARAGEIVTKSELFDAVWADVAVTDDSIVQCVTEIRRTLGDHDRSVLRTVPRKGYVLVADKANRRVGPIWRRRLSLAVPAALIAAAAIVLVADRAPEAGRRDPPSISVTYAAGDGAAETLERQVRVALSRYLSVRLLSSDAGDYVLELRPDDTSVTAELTRSATNEVIYAGEFPSGSADGRDQGARLAAAIASPMSGAIARVRLAEARRKPVSELTRYECYLHGFLLQGNQNNDNIARRTVACLNDILSEDPGDARAWALKGALLAQQYWWGVGLEGPERTDQDLRLHLPAEALAAARKGEALLDVPDSAIYYALARAYYSACEKEKTLAAARRAIEINPDDPNILGAVGNWVAYTGEWEKGAAMARRALEIEPVAYAKWWSWPIGKTAWRVGDYDAALAGFMRAFDDNNWLSHLQLAYTLPFLDRMDEAIASVARLRELRPGMTRRDARTAYERWCFEPDFLDKMDGALAIAGLPDVE